MPANMSQMIFFISYGMGYFFGRHSKTTRTSPSGKSALKQLHHKYRNEVSKDIQTQVKQGSKGY